MSTLYETAGGILNGVLHHRQGLKTLLYASKVKPDIYPKVYALVSQTILYKPIIEELMSKTKLIDIVKIPKNRTVMMIMIYDLLFGQQSIKGGGSLRRAIIARESVFRRLLDQHKRAVHAVSNQDLIPDQYRQRDRLPRYARINTLLTNLDTVQAHLQTDIIMDEHIPNLLLIPDHIQMYDHELVKNGHLILQDKASCIPAHVLLDSDHQFHHIFDACSAPGNKTLQLAAGLTPGVKLTAFERDRNRYETLCRRITQAGAASIIKTRCADFRSCSPNDPEFNDVDAIMIDPSCSGSGLSSFRIEAMLQNKTMSSDDLHRLQSHQIELILHAMRFPNVVRISYSTCSVHRIENEDVVEKILRRQSNWELRSALPSFPGRGIPNESFPNADLCVRSSAEFQTHGFFVALFVKKYRSALIDTDDVVDTVEEDEDIKRIAVTRRMKSTVCRNKINRKRKLKKTLFLR